jgi:energy-coupling factor transporter ATP-binding protein EcfA2
MRVTNFKSISNAEIRPAPLTILAGANSSGKSSLLQSILFFSQSVSSGDVVLNGDLVKLGEPNDALRSGTDTMGFDFAFPIAGRREEQGELFQTYYELRLVLGVRAGTLRPVQLAMLEDERIVLEAFEQQGANVKGMGISDRETPLKIASSAAFDLPDESYLTLFGLMPWRLIYAITTDELRAAYRKAVDPTAEGSLLLIDGFLRSVDTSSALFDDESGLLEPAISKLRQFRSRVVHGDSPRLDLSPEESERLFELYSETEAPGGWVREPLAGRANRPPTLARSAESRFDTFAWVARTSERMEGFARSIRYLGPLREDPRVVYALGHTVLSLPVGDKGEFTAGFLAESRATYVAYRNPQKQPRNNLLARAVSEWCTYLTIGEDVSVPSQGKLGFGFKLKINGIERDLTDVGVGASQLLPVVVLVLGSPAGSTVLLEQPELHLHPAVQSRLADFFAIARTDIRLLIETHSEYIVTRLRLRVAQDDLDPAHMTVLFADQVEGETRFTPLRFTDLGDFEHWPAGFFDTISNDTIELARALQDRFKNRSDS